MGISTNKPYTLIDPPVGPYHTPEEIEAWLEELRQMPASSEAAEAIEEAKGWLEGSREREQSE